MRIFLFVSLFLVGSKERYALVFIHLVLQLIFSVEWRLDEHVVGEQGEQLQMIFSLFRSSELK